MIFSFVLTLYKTHPSCNISIQYVPTAVVTALVKSYRSLYTNMNLFWGVCVPVRLGIVAASAIHPPVGVVVGGISTIGNLARWATYDKNQTGAFNQPVWWNESRLVHAMFMVLFVILALFVPRLAWVAPLCDVIYGGYNYKKNKPNS